MAAQQATSSVLKGFVSDKSVSTHAKDRIDPTGGGIPPGIEVGIAQVEKCGFAIFEKGEKLKGKPYFFVSGICQEPESIATPQGIRRCRGLYVRKQVKVFDTGEGTEFFKSGDEHVKEVMAIMRWICGDHFLDDAKTLADLEKKAAAIANTKPYFRFRTYKYKPSEKDPDPQVQISIDKGDGLQNYKGPVKQGVKEVTRQGVAATNGEKASSAAKPSSSRLARPVETAPEPEPDEQKEQGQFDEFGDIQSLGDRALAGDVEAQERLSELAEKYGVVEECSNADWPQTAEIILRASSGRPEGGDEAESTGEESEDDSGYDDKPEEKPMPVKGKVMVHSITKDGKRTGKSAKVVITAVNLKDETADTALVADKNKMKKAVPFADLEYE